MSSVFVIICETMPAGGEYPASSNDSFWDTEEDAHRRLGELYSQHKGPGEGLYPDDTLFYADVDETKYEYIEYRIEEHSISKEY